jgi:gliding motility-associated-like protein
MSYKILRPTNNDILSNSWRYQFTLKIYRDCQGSGANFDSTPGEYQANASIYRMDQKTAPVKTLIFPIPKTTKINPNPGNECVKIPPNVCVEEGIYELEFDLPIIDASYVISYQRCCRNISISNIINPGQTGATFSVEISAAAQKQRIDSPEFNQSPPVVLCAGQSFVFDQSVNTVSGDSITYALASPYIGGGPDKTNFRSGTGEAPDPDLPPPYGEVQYVGPNFTVASPFGINSLLSIDPRTGRIQGRTDVTGQFVLGIEVKKFRNGILLNTLRRDFQINVGICDTKVKASLPFPANPGRNDFTFQNCGDTKISFTNDSRDTAAISTYEWTFTGTAPGEIFKSTLRNPNIDFLKAGTYQGKLLLNPTGTCKDSLLLTVIIPQKVSAAFEIKGDSCKSNPINLTYKGSPTPKSVRWQFDATSFSQVLLDLNPNFTPPKPGNYKITLMVEGAGNCRDSSSVSFPYYPLPEISKIEHTPQSTCVGKPVQFAASPPLSASGYSAKWDFGDGGSSVSLPTATHTFLKEGSFKVSLQLTGGSGTCLKKIEITPPLNIRTGPKAAFTYAPSGELSLKQSITLSSSSGNQLTYLWQSNTKTIDTTLSTSYVLSDTGFIPISLTVTDPSTGCSDKVTQEIYVKPQIRIFIPTVFSPNFDGVNDEFMAIGDLDILKDYRMQLFSRWGNPIFISTDPLIGWDGSIGRNNELAPMDTYVYLISYTDNKGEKQYFSGTVLLMR